MKFITKLLLAKAFVGVIASSSTLVAMNEAAGGGGDGLRQRVVGQAEGQEELVVVRVDRNPDGQWTLVSVGKTLVNRVIGAGVVSLIINAVKCTAGPLLVEGACAAGFASGVAGTFTCAVPRSIASMLIKPVVGRIVDNTSVQILLFMFFMYCTNQLLASFSL